MSDPRICIVGAGNLATRRIYPNIGAAGGQLVGVCDLDVAKAQRNAGRFGGRAYTDMSAMIDAEKPDGVMICVGPQAHASLAPQVMERGIPVYTEKPPALDAAGALAVAQVSKRTGVLCTTAFKKRYNLAYSRAKEFIASGGEGGLMSISVDYCSGGYGNATPQGSFLLDFAVHLIDLIGYLAGPAAKVFAFTRDRHAYAVSIQFDGGAVGSMNLADGRSFGVPTEEVEITLNSGARWMTVHNSSCWKIAEGGKPAEWREPPTFTSAGDSGNDTGHLAEIVDFFQAIQEKRATRSVIAESYKSMVLYEAIRDSSDSGKVVDVRYEAV